MTAPRVLAFDLAKLAGLAWRDDAGVIRTRALNLVKISGIKSSHAPREHGALFAALHRAIGELIVEEGLEGKVDVFSIEDDTGRNKKTSAVLAGYRAIVKLRAQECGIRVIDSLDASSARPTIGLPGGGTDKEVVHAAARRYFGLEGTADEIDAAILLMATEEFLKAQAHAADVASTAKAIKRANRKKAA